MLTRGNGGFMDILDKQFAVMEKELYNAVLQLQEEKIKELSEKVKHLEKLLMHEPIILKSDKE